MAIVQRRQFLQKIGVGAAAGVLVPVKLFAQEGEKEEGVAPAEDLMREHGVLNRILLIYEESLRRLNAPKGGDLKPEALKESADIIRRFIEDYHEKLEEDHLFPRFEKAGKLVDLVSVLRRQHEAGRHLTANIIRLSTAGALKSSQDKKQLTSSIREFIRMYRPHETREDTVLFPALHEIVSPSEYDAMGDDFEKKEHELFGKEGFEGVVEQVSGIEKTLGIYDLSQFTPAG